MRRSARTRLLPSITDLRAKTTAALHYVVYDCYTELMPRPASFRLPEDLLNRLDEEAAERQTSATALVSMLLDEGLKTRRFPGVVYRDGPTGRRAAVVGGPDIWELIAALKGAAGKGEARLRRVAADRGVALAHVRSALEFYAAYPREIDERMAASERTATRIRRLVERRERVLSR